jgi:DNA-binding response OmpR family regulator
VGQQTVLVVDDEEAIAEAVRARLESEGYSVVVAGDGPRAIKLTEDVHPDLVVLDLMLPGMDGLEVCREIQREHWVPVLMLTARTEETDKVAGFAVGADDYLTKPFSLRELAIRVKAILRRVDRIRSLPEAEPIERGALVIDASRRRVTVDGSEVALTPLEFEILLTLARDPGVVFTRAAHGSRVGLPRLRRRSGRRLARRADPPQARRGRHGTAIHPYRARRGIRVPGTGLTCGRSRSCPPSARSWVRRSCSPSG